jgi:hypothetical protein
MHVSKDARSALSMNIGSGGKRNGSVGKRNGMNRQPSLVGRARAKFEAHNRAIEYFTWAYDDMRKSDIALLEIAINDEFANWPVNTGGPH